MEHRIFSPESVRCFFVQNSLSQNLTVLPAPSEREPLARLRALRFSRELCRYTKGRTLSGSLRSPDSPFCRYATSSPGAGEVFPLRGSFCHLPVCADKAPPFGGAGTPSGVTERVQPVEGLQKTFPQRRAFAESGAATAVSFHDPSREKAILENPQIFQNCEIINILSAEHG